MKTPRKFVIWISFCLLPLAAAAGNKDTRQVPNDWYGNYVLIQQQVVGRPSISANVKCNQILEVKHEFYKTPLKTESQIQGAAVSFSMVGTRKFIYSKIDSGVTKYPQLFGGEEIVKNKFKDNELLSYAKICDFGYCWRTPYEIKHQIYKPDADTLEFINFDIGNDAVHYCQYRKIL